MNLKQTEDVTSTSKKNNRERQKAVDTRIERRHTRIDIKIRVSGRKWSGIRQETGISADPIVSINRHNYQDEDRLEHGTWWR